jgi:hypothetical protein
LRLTCGGQMSNSQFMKVAPDVSDPTNCLACGCNANQITSSATVTAVCAALP